MLVLNNEVSLNIRRRHVIKTIDQVVLFTPLEVSYGLYSSDIKISLAKVKEHPYIHISEGELKEI